MGYTHWLSRLVPRESTQKYGYLHISWMEFVVAVIPTDSTGGQFTTEQGTDCLSSTGVNSIRSVGLLIDADNTGLLETKINARRLWQADLTQSMLLEVGFSTLNVANNNVFAFTTKYFKLDPLRSTANGYATANWTAVSTDFTAVTATSSTTWDNNFKVMSGAVIPANALSAYDQALAIQLTPAMAGSYADNTIQLDWVSLRFTRRML